MQSVFAAHTFLEIWGAMIDKEGRIRIQQPLIEPLFPACIFTIEILSSLTQKDTISPFEHVHRHWNTKWGSAAKWHYALSQGFMESSPPLAAQWNPQAFPRLQPQASSICFSDPSSLHIELALDNRMYDDRYASNPWSHE